MTDFASLQPLNKKKKVGIEYNRSGLKPKAAFEYRVTRTKKHTRTETYLSLDVEITWRK